MDINIVINKIKSEKMYHELIRELSNVMKRNLELREIGVRYKESGSVSKPLSDYLDLTTTYESEKESVN